MKRTFSDDSQISPSTTDEGFVLRQTGDVTSRVVDRRFRRLVRQRLDAALVVGRASLGNEGHSTSALEVVNGGDRRIDRQLLVVDSQTVTVSVRVREQTRLENRVSRRLDVWDKMRR